MKSGSGIKVGDTVIWCGIEMTVYQVGGKRAYCRGCVYVGDQLAKKKVKEMWLPIDELTVTPSGDSKYPVLYRSVNSEVIRKRVQGMSNAQLINETRAKLRRERSQCLTAATSLADSAFVVSRMEGKKREALLEQMKEGSIAFERIQQEMLADVTTQSRLIAELLLDQAFKECAAFEDEEQWRAWMRDRKLQAKQTREPLKQRCPEYVARIDQVDAENLELERQCDQIRAEGKQKLDELEERVQRLERACEKWEPICSSEDRPKLECARATTKRVYAELAQMRAEDNSFWQRMRSRYEAMRPERAIRENEDAERRELHQMHLELKKRRLIPALSR